MSRGRSAMLNAFNNRTSHYGLKFDTCESKRTKNEAEVCFDDIYKNPRYATFIQPLYLQPRTNKEVQEAMRTEKLAKTVERSCRVAKSANNYRFGTQEKYLCREQRTVPGDFQTVLLPQTDSEKEQAERMHKKAMEVEKRCSENTKRRVENNDCDAPVSQATRHSSPDKRRVVGAASSVTQTFTTVHDSSTNSKKRDVGGVSQTQNTTNTPAQKKNESRKEEEHLTCKACCLNFADKAALNSHEQSIAHLFNTSSGVERKQIWLSKTNVGYQMLSKLGWKEGTGLRSDALVEPIATQLKTDRSGIGCKKTPSRVTHFPSHIESQAERSRDGLSDAKRRLAPKRTKEELEREHKAKRRRDRRQRIKKADEDKTREKRLRMELYSDHSELYEKLVLQGNDF